MHSRGSPARARILEGSDVFVTFLCLYLVSAGWSAPDGDAIPMWEAARHLVRHGTFAIARPWPINAPAGVGGHFYPVSALLACLIHVPGALLQTALESAAPGRAGALVAITSHVGPLLVGAAIPALFFGLVLRLGYARRAAAIATAMLGAATSVWVYARVPYSEIVQTACFLAFFSALVEAARRPTGHEPHQSSLELARELARADPGAAQRARGALFRLGLWAGILVNSKTIYVVCLPGALAFLVWRLRRRLALRDALAALWGFLPGAVALAAYNWMRWGSPFATGYESVTHGFWQENLLSGLWGQLLSPGRSVFVFSPPLVLSLVGLRAFWRRHPDVAAALALTVLPLLLLYSRYLFWSGDWGWGPRYLVFALPVLLLPSAELFGPAREAANRRARRVLVTSVFVVGVAIQVLGSAFYWSAFIAIARTVQRQWLGRPDTRGTVMAPYPCYSCFEEIYGVAWLPPFQPIGGHWWLLRNKIAGHDARQAEADAPWKRLTSIRLDISSDYDAAQIDWWPLALGRRGWPVALMGGALLLVAIPWRAWRAAVDEPATPPPAAPGT